MICTMYWVCGFQVYTAVNSSKEKVKEGKKRHLKLEAMLDPEGHARRRIKKAEKNKEQKKRKLAKLIAHKAKKPRSSRDF